MQQMLMVDPVGDQIRPVTKSAFQKINGPAARVLARNCVSLFLTADGLVQRIEDIKVTGWSPLTHLKPFLGLETKATFYIETVEIRLEDFRLMVFDAMAHQQRIGGVNQPQWWLTHSPLESVQETLERAETFKELHQRIQFPEPKLCLGLY